MSRGGGGSAPAAVDPGLFPLRVTQRYLVSARGTPHLLVGDTPWAILGQLTNAQILTYLDARAAQGFNAILYSAPEFYYTSRADGIPTYRNVDGNDPFGSPGDTFANHNADYWARADFLYAQAIARGIQPVINPGYVGYNGTSGIDGWADAIMAASAGTLQAHGVEMATRYPLALWSMGGDWGSDSTLLDKQWNIAIGILSVRPEAIITGHPASSQQSYTYWAGKSGYGFHWVYPYETESPTPTYAWDLARQAYDQTPPRPAGMMEGKYEFAAGTGTEAQMLAMLRRQVYGALLSGALLGFFYAHGYVWHFGSDNWTEDFEVPWQDYLASTGAAEQGYAKTLFTTYRWWMLEPKTDTSLVTGSLSTGATRIVPALAIDKTFAMIYVPSSQTITVNTNALTGVSGNVRIRRFNVTTGDFTTINAGVAKTSSQSVATGAEGVIVIDAA